MLLEADAILRITWPMADRIMNQILMIFEYSIDVQVGQVFYERVVIGRLEMVFMEQENNDVRDGHRFIDENVLGRLIIIVHFDKQFSYVRFVHLFQC